MGNTLRLLTPLICLCHAAALFSQTPADTLRATSRVGIAVTPGAILHTNGYLKGENEEHRTMNRCAGIRLTYGFGASEHSTQGQRYPDTYQGAGIEWSKANHLLGNPLSVFVYQTSRIARMGTRLSVAYEWNLGLSFGWHPYDINSNPSNRVIGSHTTAFLRAAVALSWRLSPHTEISAGAAFNHYSNGNTAIPNGGLNVLSPTLALTYYPQRREACNPPPATPLTPEERRHSISWDVMAYAAYRRQGYLTDKWGSVALPNKFLVVGVNAAPMMRLSRRLRAGLSADAVLDRSANIDVDDYLVRYARHDFQAVDPQVPPLKRQMALGLSVRGELVMPFFTINAGLGRNILGAHGELNRWYQVLALKVAATPRAFIHIGYTLQDFRYPNHLMLGVGYRFGGSPQ